MRLDEEPQPPPELSLLRSLVPQPPEERGGGRLDLLVSSFFGSAIAVGLNAASALAVVSDDFFDEAPYDNFAFLSIWAILCRRSLSFSSFAFFSLAIASADLPGTVGGVIDAALEAAPLVGTMAAATAIAAATSAAAEF